MEATKSIEVTIAAERKGSRFVGCGGNRVTRSAGVVVQQFAGARISVCCCHLLPGPGQ